MMPFGDDARDDPFGASSEPAYEALVDDTIGRLLGGRYRVLEPLGSGASATVYLALDVQLDRRVAVKVLHRGLADDPSFLRRFRAEAQAAAALGHQNVLAVFDWGTDGPTGAGGLPYLVTEYLAGGSLRAMLDRGRRLSPSQALVVGLEAARGLDYAHQRGFVHRDVKPANLLFGDDGRLRIADFGLARAIAEATWTEPAGVVLGTARYASPEQAKGQAVDGRTDVYSLALTLCEAVTGSVPFAADTTVATLMGRIDRLLPVSAELGHLASIVERAGRPDPGDRFTAGEFGRALVRAAERLPRPAPLPLVRSGVPESGSTTGAVRTIPLAAQPPATPADRTVIGDATVIAGPGAPPPVRGATAGVSGVSGIGSPSRQNASAPERVGATVLREASAAAGLDGAELDTAAASFASRDRRQRRRLFVALGGALLAGLLAAGGIALSLRGPATFPVGTYAGQDAGAVENDVAARYRWTVQTTPEKDDDVQIGHVIRQNPASGARLAKGGTLELVVSEGPKLRSVPDVAKASEADAVAKITAAGLTPSKAGDEFSEELDAGIVLRWTVDGRTLQPTEQVPKGQTVAYVVSKGPQPRARPSLKDQTWEQAQATLAAVQLVAARGPEENSDTVAAGIVIRATPPVGEPVPRGGSVEVVVSLGPLMLAVPDLTGKTAEEAAAVLQGIGFPSGRVVAGSPLGGKVVGQSVPAGQAVPHSTVIEVTLG